MKNCHTVEVDAYNLKREADMTYSNIWSSFYVSVHGLPKQISLTLKVTRKRNWGGVGGKKDKNKHYLQVIKVFTKKKIC